jgi:hypothetical protein
VVGQVITRRTSFVVEALETERDIDKHRNKAAQKIRDRRIFPPQGKNHRKIETLRTLCF